MFRKREKREWRRSRKTLRNQANGDFNFLRGLTSAELDDLLDEATFDAENDDLNVELIIAVMDEFERRDPQNLNDSELEIEKSLERFDKTKIYYLN